MELINEIKGTMADVPLVLVGNKNDEEAGPREVSYATGETLQVAGELGERERGSGTELLHFIYSQLLNLSATLHWPFILF